MGEGRDRGALGARGTSLGFRVAGGRGRWSSPARRSPWDVEHKARGVLQATGFPYCSGRGLGLRSPTPDGKNRGTRAPRGKGRTARGQRAAVGPSTGQGAGSLCLPSARYLQSGLSPSSVGTVRSAPSPPPSRLDGHTVPRGPGRTGPRVRRDQDLGARRGVLKDRRKMLFRAVRDHPAIIKKKQNRTSCHLLQSGCARLCTKPQVPRDKQEPEPGGRQQR